MLKLKPNILSPNFVRQLTRLVMADDKRKNDEKKLKDLIDKADQGAETRQAEFKSKIDKLSDLFDTFKFGSNEEQDSEQPARELKKLDLESFANYMKNCRNIVFLNGAGISTAAGIPDFRTPGTGLYDNLQKYNLPDPHCIFDLGYFKQNPKPFFTLAKELLPSDYRPTLSHYFQRLLVEKGIVKRIYSQNIDALEQVAKVDEDKVIYAHGSFKTGHCLTCKAEYSFDWIKKNIHDKEFLKCEKCGDEENESGLVKPDIVFFGERMPENFMKMFRVDLSECDCLIVIGTSLKVQPFSLLPGFVADDCPRLLINRDLVGDWALYESEPAKNKRDVAFQGDCDSGCLKLAQLLGFDKELRELVKNEQAKFKPRAK